MHAANICAENYANDKNTQVDTTRRAHPPTANCAYQQLSDAADLFAAYVPPARRLHPACTPHVFHSHPARTHQPAHNR